MAQQPDRRTAILNAAEKVFVRDGYAAAGTLRIARAAGVSEGTLYNYFTSREDIFLSLFEDRWNTLTEDVRKRIGRVQDPNEKLKAVFSSVMKLFARNRALARIFLIEIGPGSIFSHPKVVTRMADFLDLLEGILVEGKKAGKYNPKMDTRVARMIIYGAAQGILLGWLLQDSVDPGLRKRFRYSFLKASQTTKLILKSGLSAAE